MTHYHLWRCDDDDADSYWVEADTALQARRLIALNVAEAPDAEDPMRFDCGPASSNAPPPDTINRRLKSPVTITKR